MLVGPLLQGAHACRLLDLESFLASSSALPACSTAHFFFARPRPPTSWPKGRLVCTPTRFSGHLEPSDISWASSHGSLDYPVERRNELDPQTLAQNIGADLDTPISAAQSSSPPIPSSARDAGSKLRRFLLPHSNGSQSLGPPH